VNKKEAKEIYDNTVKPYKDRLELARAEHKELERQCNDALKERRKAYAEYKEVAKTAQTLYYRSIGE
jgi:hypothetical protein